MEKTTVYLSAEQVAALKRKALTTGRSRSELIREGVDRVTEHSERVFHSMGVSEGDGKPFDADAYLREHWADDLRTEGRVPDS
jgi:Arc/MetJ-type ribon-helix-helix transcriptional regulator